MTTFAKWSLVAITLVSSTGATPLSTYPHDSPIIKTPLSLAPLIVAEHPHGTLNNSYIVRLKQGSSQALIANHFNFLHTAHNADPLHGEGSGVTHVYDSHKFSGYAGRFSASVVQQLRTKPEVAYVEQDQVVRTQDTQKNAPWGLARISHRPRLTFSTFTKYEHDPQGGEGVDVYVIDTGININHVEFGGRASWGKTIPMNDVDEDGNGHGTHCAGTIASRKYGVAKKANVIAVKVLGSNGSGTMSDVVAGVVFATDQAVKKAKAAAKEFHTTGSTKHKGSVANMSLGGGKSRALDEAVNSAVDAGVHFAVAAGNDNRDACSYSPAAAEKAITVGASTLGDDRAYFSNYGKCVDVFAPGLNILSTWIGSTSATNTISGTSMASPHTAGLLAYLLSSDEFLASLESKQAPHATSVIPSSVYAVMQATFSRWMSSFLSLAEPTTAPVPSKPITPAAMKKALLKLATLNALSELPPDTINLLIFNNATMH